MSIKVGTPRSLMLQLKALDLWEIEEREFSEVPPVVFTNFPNRLNELNIDARKKMFLHSLLPVVMIAMAEVQGERVALQMALEKLGNDSTIIFSDENPDWQERLSDKEKIFIRTITEKYRTHQAGELLDRVDVLPVSLVLAQAAFESFWGTSRFAKQGNNLFGMWTWGKQGIIPARREPGKTHKLAVYDSIFDAVQIFVLTLNRLPAYENLRKIRQNSMDSMTIADGLLHYSERGEDYIADVKTIIQYNELTKYDSFVLGNSMNLPPAVKQLASL
jgi:Bax protein